MRIKVLTERPMGKKIIDYLVSVGEEIVDESPDMIIVAYYPHILTPAEIDSVPLGVINLHPGYLPYNRGMYPNIWPLIDWTPAGVTIHYIDSGIDTGDIIDQRLIKVKITDTAGSLEKRLQKKMLKLFKEVWESKFWLFPRSTSSFPQHGHSTFHYAKEISSIQEIGIETINKLRACTFKDRSYAYFMHNGKKIYVGVKFFKQEDIDRFNRSNHWP